MRLTAPALTAPPGVTATTSGITHTTGRSYTSHGATISVDVYGAGPDATNRDARLFRTYAASSVRGIDLPFVYTVKDQTGGALANGDYTWRGVHLVGAVAGEFQIVASLNGAATDTFTYSTPNRATNAADIAGSGTFNTPDGTLSASGANLTLTPYAGGTEGTARNLNLRGELGGASGAAIVGVFGTDGASALIGGFVGRGPQIVETVLGETATHVGLGYVAGDDIGSGTVDGFVFIADKFANLLNATGSPSDAVRDASFVASIDPTLATASATDASIGTAYPEARARKIAAGTNAFGTSGENYVVTNWHDAGNIARVSLFDDEDLTGTGLDSGSFYAAGRTVATPAGQFTGAFTWAGVLVSGARDLGAAAPTESGFQLTADFSVGNDGNGIFTGGTTHGALSVLTTIDAATGRISARTATTQISLDGTPAGGAISGYVGGATAQAVSGVFTTSIGANILAGGFAGGAPQVGRDLRVRTGTKRLFHRPGQQERLRRGLAHGAGQIYFLFEENADYESARDALNNLVSDTTRNEKTALQFRRGHHLQCDGTRRGSTATQVSPSATAPLAHRNPSPA